MTQFLGKIVADFQTQLATVIEVGGTSATLQSATDDDGVALPSGRYFFTIDGDNTSKEHISCELSGTSLTSIKTVTRQGTESSGTARKHRVGASVTITNFKHIKAMNDLLDGTTDFDASTPLKYDGTATISDNDAFATKAYVDGVAIAGAADASTSVKGISKMSVAPASASEPIAVGDNDPRVPTADENDALAGTSGSPSTSNKYVTDDDTSGTGDVVRSSYLGAALFGDGSDGDVVISTNTTLTRDMYYDNLTIDSGIDLIPDGYRIFVKGTLTNNGNIIANGAGGAVGTDGQDVTSDGNGAEGTGGAGGSGNASGAIYGSTPGQDGDDGDTGSVGGVDVNYTQPSATANSFTGVDGAQGGDGGEGGGSQSVQILTQTPEVTNKTQYINNTTLATILFNPTGLLATAGEAGGGGGGTAGAGNTSPQASGGGAGGGGGGESGGIVAIYANTITNESTISANGGAGGAGGAGGDASGGSGGRNYAGGGGGGGAGGSGGAVIVITYGLTDNGTIEASGGTGGTGGAGGTSSSGGASSGDAGGNGSNGIAGLVYTLTIS